MTAPANDNFANATVITGTSGTTTPVTIDEATVEGSEDNAWSPSSNHQTVWYKWTAPTTDLYSFSTNGSLAGDGGSGDGNSPPGGFGNLDTRLVVWTGTTLGSLTQVTRNDDSDVAVFLGSYSVVSIEATEGITYYFQVGTFFEPYTGTVVLTWQTQIRPPRILDSRTFSFSLVSSFVPTMTYHEPGDVVVIFAAANSASATLTADGTWTEVTNFTLPVDVSPWLNGAFAKIWYREAPDYNMSAPTITLDTSRSGAYHIWTLEGPIDFGLLSVTSSSIKPSGTQAAQPPAISPFATGALPLVYTPEVAADAVTFTAFVTTDDSGTRTGGSNNGTGVAIGFESERIHSGESYQPFSYFTTDNPALAGTHYPPAISVSIAWYSAGERTRTWHAGSENTGTTWTSTSEAAWDGVQYAYLLGTTGSAATTAGHFARYDIATDTYTTLTAIPGKYVNRPSLAYWGGKVYVFGGDQGNNGSSAATRSRTTRVYTVATDSWSTATSMPPFRIGFLVNNISNTDTSFDVNEDTSDVFINTSTTDGLWIDNEAMRHTAQKTHVSGNVYTYHVARGIRTTSAVSHTANTEVDGGGSGTNADHPVGGYSEGGYAITDFDNDRIYVFPGFGLGTNPGGSNAFFMYNPVNDTWHQQNRLPAGQEGGNIVLDGDGKIHAIGANIDGIDNSQVVYPAGISGFQYLMHEVYDINAGTWTVKANMPNPNAHGFGIQPELAISMYVASRNVILTQPYLNLGGNNNGAYYDDRFIEVYDITNDSWSSDPQIDVDRHYTGIGYGTAATAYDEGMGVGHYGNRHVFFYNKSGASGLSDSPTIVYFDITPAQAQDVLSTVATLDHDLIIGVEQDQHHTRLHLLEPNSGEHTGGLFYKSGTHEVPITDADFTTPVDGMVAITYGTELGTGITHRVIWVRANGVWRGVEA